MGKWQLYARHFFIKPLTQELGITLNDFICGEKVEVENYQQKTEENMDLILQEYYQMKKQRKNFENLSVNSMCHLSWSGFLCMYHIRSVSYALIHP